MKLNFHIITQRRKLTKANLSAFLDLCASDHLVINKFDYKEPTKKTFDPAKPGEVFDLYKEHENFVLKGKNDFWISTLTMNGLLNWDGAITIKKPEQATELANEIISLFLSLCKDGQLLFAHVSTSEEYDTHHYRSANGVTGWKGVSVREFAVFFPGVYWCTFFGAEMVERIGRNKFVKIPGVEYLDTKDKTIALRLNTPVVTDDLVARKKQTDKIIQHIGSALFFDLQNMGATPSYPEPLIKWMKGLNK